MLIGWTWRTSRAVTHEVQVDGQRIVVCPIVLLRVHMQENGQLNDQQMQELDEKIKKEVQEAWDFADNSPEPPLEALFEDILVDTTSDSHQMSSRA